MGLGIASVGGITVIATLIGAAWKTSDKLPDKWIPVICGATGLILGIVGYLIKIPDFPASDVINAAAVGVVSGFAATGINQIFKQFNKDKEEDEPSDGPSDPDDDEESTDGPSEIA